MGVENMKEVSFYKEKWTKISLFCLISSVGLPWDTENARAQGHFLENHWTSSTNKACGKTLSQPSFLFLSLYLSRKHKN